MAIKKFVIFTIALLIYSLFTTQDTKSIKKYVFLETS